MGRNRKREKIHLNRMLGVYAMISETVLCLGSGTTRHRGEGFILASEEVLWPIRHTCAILPRA